MTDIEELLGVKKEKHKHEHKEKEHTTDMVEGTTKVITTGMTAMVGLGALGMIGGMLKPK